jgi:ankyrin repeat protein
VLLISNQIRNYIYLIVACCSGISITKAMEQETPDIEKRTEEEQVSSCESLPSELKVYIIGFLVSAEDAKGAVKAVRDIKYLAATSKCFYNFINDPQVLDTLIQEISKQFVCVYPIDVALAFKNSSALRWLKDYLQQNPSEKARLNDRLMNAANFGKSSTLVFALNAGADVNTQDSCGYTPLHSAVQEGHKDTVELLLNAGADVNSVDKYSQTPLHRIFGPGNKGVNKDSINKDIVELLLKHGANINQATDNGNTPFNRAAHRGLKEIIELLLQYEANVNQANNEGYTPLHHAASNGRKDIVELLLNAGANVNKANNEGKTPLYVAVSYCHWDIVELLRAYGAIE